MPPTRVHFNGGVNLEDAETVIREICSRVGSLARHIPDGETGDRNYWVYFQFPRLQQADGLVDAGTRKMLNRKQNAGDDIPQVRVADGVDPDAVRWPNLGYADVYRESYATFCRLRDEGVVDSSARFQVEYPTPTAPLTVFVRPEDQTRIFASYERALFADLNDFLSSVPHDDVAVQWDGAAEFGILEDADWYNLGPYRYPELMVPRMAACVDAVPRDVPVGLHLCYGDYKHQHESEPESLALQVDFANRVTAQARRRINFVAFTVPQYRGDKEYFAPLTTLRVSEETELYFGIVPYHPDEQEPGILRDQVNHIDEILAVPTSDGPVAPTWGVCTECGMARAEREDIPRLLDLHRQLVEGYTSISS